MGKKPGRRSKNRPPKPVRAVEQKLGPIEPPFEDKYVSIDRDPLCFVAKITGVQRNYTDETIIVHTTSLEDTIRPVDLKFPAPMSKHGKSSKGFEYHWQTLTYLFGLNDPREFSSLRAHVSDDDLQTVARYYEMCRNLAGYSIISRDGSFKLTSDGGEWSVAADLPSHEAFAGFSATFRQIHNDMENASFVKVWNILNKAASGLEDADAATARVVLKSWKKARSQLMQKMAATLVCERLLPQAPDDAPKTYKGIVPDDLIKAYNYGDSLHWGDQRETLASLTDDPYNRNFHKHACGVAMTQLSHLYFGFAELAMGAMRQAQVGPPTHQFRDQ